MSKKFLTAIIATTIWSSSAFALCDVERRAYEDVPRQCAQKWNIQNDINQCINEERAKKETEIKQCFRDINAGKRER